MLEKLQLTFSTVSTQDYRKSNFMFCQILHINSNRTLNSLVVHIAKRKQKLTNICRSYNVCSIHEKEFGK